MLAARCISRLFSSTERVYVCWSHYSARSDHNGSRLCDFYFQTNGDARFLLQYLSNFFLLLEFEAFSIFFSSSTLLPYGSSILREITLVTLVLVDSWHKFLIFRPTLQSTPCWKKAFQRETSMRISFLQFLKWRMSGITYLLLNITRGRIGHELTLNSPRIIIQAVLSQAKSNQ